MIYMSFVLQKGLYYILIKNRIYNFSFQSSHIYFHLFETVKGRRGREKEWGRGGKDRHAVIFHSLGSLSRWLDQPGLGTECRSLRLQCFLQVAGVQAPAGAPGASQDARRQGTMCVFQHIALPELFFICSPFAAISESDTHL